MTAARKTGSQIQREIDDALHDERLPVKAGILTLDKPMTRVQAKRWGDRHMPSDLKRVGFETFVSKSDPAMHGGLWYRVSYGYGGRGRRSTPR